jgi:MFS family permease
MREVIVTDIARRLDSLGWSRFHTKVALALGITWALDGLEVTLAGAVAGALSAPDGLGLSTTEVGASASAYLVGAVLGALLFGWLTDLWGRRRLFFITLGLYLLATAATAFSQDFWTLALFRFLTGMGIGGEYAAINSAIQELVPARYRGRTDLAINGSYWLGAMLGSAGASILLNPELFAPDLGWRLAFGIGAILGAVVLVFRRSLPESPRWLIIRGRVEDAERTLRIIEQQCSAARIEHVAEPWRVHVRRRAAGLVDLGVSLFKHYPRRSVLGLALMVAQAFCYNAIFFTYTLVLGEFFAVSPDRAGLYLLPFSVTNFLGPLALGWLFDAWGRRQMITLTYVVSGALLGVTALLFVGGHLTAMSQTVAFAMVFFFASAAASSAYLTVSESFPLEIRALSIAVFYALGTGIGGVAAPWVFGALIGTGDPEAVAVGYAIGASLMIAAGTLAWWLAIPAERRPLEEVATPLSSREESG